MTLRAFTRAVSPRIAECELTHLERVPIDSEKAAAQHSAYEQALREAGFEVVRLPELADDPDAVFVEDTALILGEHAVITRPGVASRANQVHRRRPRTAFRGQAAAIGPPRRRRCAAHRPAAVCRRFDED